MSVHHLKTDHDVFGDMENGKKLFEFRKNDRDFRVGDWLNLVEYNPETKASGFSIDFEVTYILYGGKFGIPEGYCVMQLKRLEGNVSWVRSNPMNREQMKPEKAIEILKDLWQCPHMKGMTTQNDAIKLGIEALKCLSLLNSEGLIKIKGVIHILVRRGVEEARGVPKVKATALIAEEVTEKIMPLFPHLLNKKEEK